MQIHDDIAFNRVEAFIRGEDNETLVGTEALPKRAAPHARHGEGARQGRREVTSAPGSPGAPDGAPGTAAGPGDGGTAVAALKPAMTRTAGAQAGAAAELRAPHRRQAPGRRFHEKSSCSATGPASALLGHLPLGPASHGRRLAPRARLLRALAGEAADRPGERRPGPGPARIRPGRRAARPARLPEPGPLGPGGDAPRPTSRRSEIRPRSTSGARTSSTPRGRPPSGVIVGRRCTSATARPPRPALAGRGWPMHAVADDTAYEELFEHLARERERLGRRARSAGATSARSTGSCAAARSSACSSTGATGRTESRSGFFERLDYVPGRAGRARREDRSDDRPVLGPPPAGRDVRRRGRRAVHHRGLGRARPSSRGRHRPSPTALEAGIRRAPEQWCVFKPIWPADPAEERRLAALDAEQVGAGAPAG